MQESLFALPYIHPKGGKPYVRLNYFDERVGRWKSKERRVSTVEEAIDAYEELKRKVGAQPKDYDPDKMTFDELVAEYKKAKPATPDWRLDTFKDYFGKRRIKTITYGDLAQFRREREAVVSEKRGRVRKPASINREMQYLRSMLLYAVRHEWLAGNPFNKGSEPLIRLSEEEPRDRIPSPEEEARILQHCVGPRAHVRAVLIALKDTGLRKGAMLSLTWKSVDFEEGFVEIPKGKANKGRPKVIGMTARLRVELLALWEKSEKKPESRIFAGVGDFKKAYATACRKAGVEDLHVHDWRHGFATDLMESGVEERIAMKATGHTNPETHAIYTNIDKRIARMIAESLDRLHSEREKPARLDVTDGTSFVS
jgi:integrase